MFPLGIILSSVPFVVKKVGLNSTNLFSLVNFAECFIGAVRSFVNHSVVLKNGIFVVACQAGITIVHWAVGAVVSAKVGILSGTNQKREVDSVR